MVLVVLTVQTVEPAPEKLAGLNDAVAFVGKPDAEKFTTSAKPLIALTVLV